MEILAFIFQGIFKAILWFWWILVPILAVAAWQNKRKAVWAEKQEHVLLTIKIPRSNEKDPTAAEMMFAAMHGILRPKVEKTKEGSMQEYLSFEMVANAEAIHFYVGVPSHLRDFIESQIYAQYPTAEIKIVEDYTKDIDIDDDGINDELACAELVLNKNDIIPIKTFANFKVDPLAGITSALAKLDNDREQVWIQILTRPLPDEWQSKGISYIRAKKSGQSAAATFSENPAKYLLMMPLKLIGELARAFMGAEEAAKKEAPKLSPDVESSLSAIEEKCSKLGYEVKVRIIALAKTKLMANQRMQAAIGAFKQFNTVNLNSIVAKNIIGTNGFLEDYRSRAFYDKGFIFNIEELASIYHLPHTSVETPNINWTSSKTAEPPTDLPTTNNSDPQDLTVFAETNFRHQSIKFGIRTDDRRRHTYIIGKSGMGKSKLLELMIGEDIKKGNGVAVIDPNGDLIIETLKKIPEERIKDVILIDPADTQFPIAFNPLEYTDESMKSFVAQGFISVLVKMFGHSWGPRLEYILNYTILALLDYPDRTILGITRMLTDKNFRKKVVENIKDPVVKKFWVSEFSTYTDKFATEAVAPILNKVGQFAASPMIRNILGQPVSSFDIREAMDTKKILLINLATGRVGEVNSSLLGGLLITKIQLAAMSRANIDPEDRVDFSLYVDEFQHFANESFATILSEARKYKLSLIVANQYIAQMDETVREAVFGNVGTMITFKVGAQDASVLEKELKPPFEVNDIINLDRQEIYLKTSIDGKTSNPFSAKTVSLKDENFGNTQKIIEQNRAKFATPVKEVEQKIALWNNISIDGPKEDAETSNEPKQEIIEPETKEKTESKPETLIKEPAKQENNNQAPKAKAEVKSNYQHKKPERKENKVNKDNLREIIRKAVETKETPLEKEKQVTTATEKPIEEPNKVQPAKEIDKQAIKNILESAVRPSTKDAKPEQVAQTKNKEIVFKNPNINHQDKDAVATVNNKTNNIILDSKVSEEKEGTKTEKRALEGREDHKIEKTEKIVTPNNFGAMTEIHPHEKVIIKNETVNATELKLGEEVRFKKDDEPKK